MSKPLVNVYMGQAAVVYLTKYNLYSAQFSTCCPVVMFNHCTKRAGYYHMPGKTDLQGRGIIGKLSASDWETIEDMAIAVKPTKVWIFPGHSVGQVVQARDPMQAALNAHLLAMRLDETRLKIPQKTKVGLSVTMPDDKIKFSTFRPEYKMGNWFDSQRDRDKMPTETDGVLFWGWDIDVSVWFSLLDSDV
jgi:hypothetical protein